MHDKQKSEDMAQEAALLMQRGIATLKSPQAFDSWMYRVVFNACMNEKKKMKRTPENIEIDSQIENEMQEARAEFIPESFVSDEEKRTRLLEIIGKLPEKHRICILLFYYEEMPYSEIAETLEISVNDVSYRLRVARDILRRELACAFPEEANELVAAKAPAAFVAIPVITQVLRLDEQSAVSAHMVERFISVVATSSGVAGLGAVAVTATAVTTSLVTKVLGGAAAVGIAAAGAFMAFTAATEGPETIETENHQIEQAAPQSEESSLLPEETITEEHSVDYAGSPQIVFSSLRGTDSPYEVTGIEFIDNVSELVSVTWSITSSSTGEEERSGEGSEITFNPILSSLAPGEYKVSFLAIDATGGTARTYRSFNVV